MTNSKNDLFTVKFLHSFYRYLGAWALVFTCALSTQAQNFFQTAKVVADTRLADDQVGNSVSISGDYAVVGAQLEDEDEAGSNALTNAGAAYVFKKQSDGTWAPHQKIVSPTRVAGVQFGSAVSISGNYLIVGASLDNTNKGAAYVFELDTDDKWKYKNTLTASDGADSDLFGFSVSITNIGYAVVGAYGNNEGGEDAGAAYIFERNASTQVWEQKQKVGTSNGADKFGYSVAIDKDKLVCGAPEKNSGKGEAYTYGRNTGGTWQFVSTLKAPTLDQQNGEGFGLSVAIYDDVIVVGAPKDSQRDDTGTDPSPLTDAGAVYIFNFNTASTWDYKSKKVALDRRAGANFGQAVGISENNIVVGAQKETNDAKNDNSLTDAGAAYIFHLDASNAWVQTKKMVAKDREANASFGNVVAIDDDYVVVGAPTETKNADGNTSISGAGAAYIFQNNTTFNGGVSFDGSTSSNYIELPNESTFDFTTEVTIECWVKLSSTLITGSNDQAIISKGDDAWELNIKESGGTARLAFVYYGSNGRNEVISTSAVDFNDTKWHHVAITFDGRETFSKRFNMYIDGASDQSTFPTVNIDTNDDPVRIGANVDIPTAFFNGAVSDLRIWKTIRKDTDIANFKNCQLDGGTPCLLAYYKLNEGLPNGNNTSISTVKDDAGSNDGVIAGLNLTGGNSNFVDVDPANERTPTTCSAILPAKIEVSGKGVLISNGGSVTPDNDTDVGPVPVNYSISLVYTIKNAGTGVLDLTKLSVENTDVFSYTPPAETVLNPGETATLTIVPQTSNLGLLDNTITILTNDCDNSKFVFDMQIMVQELPEIDIQNSSGTSVASGGTIDLGAQAVGKTNSQSVNILNTSSSVVLTLKGNPTVTVAPSTEFTVSNLPASGSTIEPVSNTSFTVNYTPTSVGTHTATLTIESDDFDEGTYTIKLTGQGANPEINVQTQSGVSQASGSSIGMGTYTLGETPITQTLTIQNTGSVPLTLTEQPSTTGNAGFSVTQTSSNLEIAAGGTADIQISFRPSSSGAATGTLQIKSNDPDEGTYTINLTGTAIPSNSQEIAVVYDSTGTDGTVTRIEAVIGDTIAIDTTAALNVKSIDVYIKNQGLANLLLNGSPLVSVSGNDASEFNVDLSAAASTIAPEDSTLVKINFAPVSTNLGKKVTSIIISSNDVDEGTYTINLKSVSIQPPSTPTDVNIVPVTLPATTTNTTRNALSITWATPSDIGNVDGFKIKRSDGNTDNFQEIADITDLSTTSYQDLNLEEGVQYYYRVFSYNRYGESEPGELQSLVYVGTPEEQQLSQQTKVYPNPAQDWVRVDLPKRQAATIKLYSPTGRLLQTRTFAAGQTPNIAVQGLATGKYTLQIKVGKLVIYKPLVKR